jgi:hypothetical protein
MEWLKTTEKEFNFTVETIKLDNEEGVEHEEVDEEESDIEEEGEFGKEVDGKSHGEDAFWGSLKPKSRELRNLQS